MSLFNNKAAISNTGSAANAPVRPFALSKKKRILIAIAALIYAASPVDFIPDVIPVLGWLDDIGVLAIAARYIFKRS